MNIEPVQLNLFDMQLTAAAKWASLQKQQQALDGAEDDEEFLSFVEDDQTPPGKVVREFKV